MTRHNALQMLGRSGNPALSATTFKNEGVAVGQVMTLQGTVNKTGVLLALLILSASYTWNIFFQTGNPSAVAPAMIGGAIGGLILALITIFKNSGQESRLLSMRSYKVFFLGESRPILKLNILVSSFKQQG